MDIVTETEKSMAQSKDHLHEELKHIRTGRADPQMLNSVKVEAYGSSMRLKELATITSPEPRQILVTPFDSQNLGAIRKGIEVANLGINPIVDGNLIRLNVPPMDQSMRADMVKRAKKKGEDTKISIRNTRRDGNEALKKQKSSGDLPEDLMKKGEHDIQKLTDHFCKEIDEIISCKEKDILAI